MLPANNQSFRTPL